MKLLCTLIASLVLSACAAMQQDFQARTCHYDGAYQAGVNAAQANEQMNGEAVAQQCPADKQAEVRKGYREGYMTSKTNKPAVTNINIGSSTPRDCIEKYGKKECGYGCKEAYGKIRCAHTPGNSCLEAYGQIKCGSNCHEEYGQIKCDSYE